MKISCDAKCERCYHEKGRRQDLDVNELVLFCTSCKRVYLCEIGLVHIGTSYYCPFDNTMVIKEEVDKSIIQMKGIPGENQAASEELYHKLVGGKSEKRKKPGFALGKHSSKTISAYHHSKVSELNDIKNLDRNLILEVAKDHNISELNRYQNITSKKDLLDQLGRRNPQIIDYLYAALISFEDVPKSLEIRFAVYAPLIVPNIKQINIADPTLKSDLRITTLRGKEIWVFCSDHIIDLPDIDKFIEKAKEIDYVDYPLVSHIYFISKKFSYVAKGLLAKYQSAFTGIEQTLPDGTVDISRSIPLSLWEPQSRKIAFSNVSFV